jgi:hypothetical protein
MGCQSSAPAGKTVRVNVVLGGAAYPMRRDDLLRAS